MTEGITFEEYNDLVLQTAIYPSHQSIVYPALGIGGEAGEVQEKIKKWLRSDGRHNLDGEALVKELGDVLWYVTALARDLGYGLQDVAAMNRDKLLSRKERNVLEGDGDDR